MSQNFTRCLQKRSFRTRLEAQREAAKMNRGKGKMHAYKCPNCRRYHMGNTHFQPVTNASRKS